jgi:hypothetical protein
MHHLSNGLYNRSAVCCLWGTKWFLYIICMQCILKRVKCAHILTYIISVQIQLVCAKQCVVWRFSPFGHNTVWVGTTASVQRTASVFRVVLYVYSSNTVTLRWVCCLETSVSVHKCTGCHMTEDFNLRQLWFCSIAAQGSKTVRNYEGNQQYRVMKDSCLEWQIEMLPQTLP